MYDLFRQIKDFIKPEDTVICLGDCGDRGPDGWKIIREVLTSDNWIYLKGNHEDMLAKAILVDDEDTEPYDLLCYNGGFKTLMAWSENTKSDESWGIKLKSLPYHYEYINQKGQMILLSHSGYNPIPAEERSKPYVEHDFIWNRNHLNTKKWCGEENMYMVHGHTPVVLASKGRARPELLRIENYCEGHKFNIDLAAWYTGVCCLLDIDTFEEYYFYTEPI
jgi:hypothetical protein